MDRSSPELTPSILKRLCMRTRWPPRVTTNLAFGDNAVLNAWQAEESSPYAISQGTGFSAVMPDLMDGMRPPHAREGAARRLGEASANYLRDRSRSRARSSDRDSEKPPSQGWS
jgi:hypothetical protein